MEIKNQWVRYVLPFSYKNTDKDTYNSICKKIDEKTYSNKKGEQKSMWRRITFEEYGELDLYEHIKKIAQGEDSNEKIWVTSDDIGRKDIYFDENGEKVRIYINKMGIQLFFSGVGFLWFEADLQTKDNRKLLERNNILKEFAYTREFYEKKGRDIYEKFDFGNYILSHISDIPINTYFINRTKNIEGKKILIPDKYLIFSWFLSSDSVEGNESENFIKLFSKGYTYKYKVNETEGFFEPFDNFIWSSCKEGCGGIAMQDANNSDSTVFFESNFESRLEIYFQLYILVMNQYYSNLMFLDELADIPREIKKCNVKSLEAMDDRFSLMQIQSNHLQVSHITHQNEFYRYLKAVMKLDIIVEEIEYKIEAVKIKVETYKEEVKRKRMLYFTWISTIFVFVEMLDGVSSVVTLFKGGMSWEAKTSLNVMGIVAAVVFLVWSIYYLVSNNKKR